MLMYFIYRITNNLNGHTYIGKHQYKDLSMDQYMGSGKYLWNAYNKYGIENFKREIIISGIETLEEINELEKEYIRLERESGHSEYNIANGGDGGSLPGELNPNHGKRYIHDSEGKEKLLSPDESLPEGYYEGRSDQSIKALNSNRKPTTRGKIRIYNDEGITKLIYPNEPIPEGFTLGTCESTKNKISESRIGSKNPHYGMRYIHNDNIQKYIPKGAPLPEGYFEGVSEQFRDSCSKGNKGENNPCYNKRHVHNSDGVEICIPKDAPLPEGYYEGRGSACREGISKATKGRIWIHKGTLLKRIYPNELDEYISNGYELGILRK